MYWIDAPDVKLERHSRTKHCAHQLLARVISFSALGSSRQSRCARCPTTRTSTMSTAYQHETVALRHLIGEFDLPSCDLWLLVIRTAVKKDEPLWQWDILVCPLECEQKRFWSCKRREFLLWTGLQGKVVAGAELNTTVPFARQSFDEALRQVTELGDTSSLESYMPSSSSSSWLPAEEAQSLTMPSTPGSEPKATKELFWRIARQAHRQRVLPSGVWEVGTQQRHHGGAGAAAAAGAAASSGACGMAI